MRHIFWSEGPYLLRPRHVFGEGGSRKLRPVCGFALVFLFLPFSELLLLAPIRFARCQPVTVHCSGEKIERIKFVGALALGQRLRQLLRLKFLHIVPASYAAMLWLAAAAGQDEQVTLRVVEVEGAGIEYW